MPRRVLQGVVTSDVNEKTVTVLVERRTAHEMHMQVIHLLPAVGVAVDDQSIAILGNALAFREIARNREHMTDQRLVFIGDVVRCCDGLVRHDQQMHGSSRMNIPKGSDSIILVNDIGRQFAFDDAFEEGWHDVSTQYL